uniref:Uncharacterized protein n=1 Tax=Leersia perrieri TaxID=77586 RepID=A0A0D9Y0L2_9ORYZ
MSSAPRANGGGGGWLHAAWLALTGGVNPAQLFMAEEEVAGGDGSGGGSHYELVRTEDSDDGGEETRWGSGSEPASEADLFIPSRKEDLKTTTNSPESVLARGELRVRKPEFWRWSAAKKIIIAAGNSDGDGESESTAAAAPLIVTRRRGENRINDAEMKEEEDHPFCFGRHGRMESSSSSFLLLSSS